MSLLFVLEGCEVRSTGSGTETLKMVETFLPDAALIDETLPQMSGLKLAGLLRG
jgi:CheY-like chemotaxis protein